MNALITIDQYLKQRAPTRFEIDEQMDLAIRIPGTILNCGIPKVEQRAKEIWGRGSSQRAIEKVLHMNPHSHILHDRVMRELVLRAETELDFHSIFEGEFSLEILEDLKRVLFGQLYRVKLPTEVGYVAS